VRHTWTFHSAGQLLFGRNAVSAIGEVAERLQVRHLLLVTDAVLLKAGAVERIHAALSEGGVSVELFTRGEPEPSLRLAEACLAQAQQCLPDAILGLGGGSNMDLAKIAATALAHDGTPRDYLGNDRIPGPITPLICVPTTAGSGSEVSGAAILTDTEQHQKVAVLSNHLRPRVALVDPLLTVSCPAQITADAGIEALTHAIEAYTAVDHADFTWPPSERPIFQGRHPLGDLMAEKAIALIGRYLRRAVADGTDLEAREGMSLGATLSGLAFSNVGMAAVDALADPLGRVARCSPGAANGLLLPAVMRFNLPARRAALAAIARLLGEDVSGMDEQDAAEQAVAAVDSLRSDIGIPLRLRDLGVDAGQLRPLAETAIAFTFIPRVNPRPMTIEDVETIYRSVL
jgi:alcohol dehydrogenase class IV